MDGKNCVAGFYVALSPEATAKLPLSETELHALARTYRDFPLGKALKVLFRFYYGTREQKKEAIGWFKPPKTYMGEDIFFKDEYLDNLLLYGDEEFRLLADELLIQYQADNTIFLDINSIKGIPDGCQEELSIIKERMAEHPVLLFRTVEKCVQSHKKDLVSRCVLQLFSNNTADDTLALESLGFKFEYRILLLPFSKEIGMLLLAMHKSYLKKQKLLTIQDSFALPLIELLKQMKSIQQNVLAIQEDRSTEEAEENNFYEISFFETEVLKFIEISSEVTSSDCRFDAFTKYRQKLEHLAQAIISLMEAKLTLIEIETALTKSNTEFAGHKNDSILLAAATNIPLTKKMFEAEKSYNEAKIGYDFASSNLYAFLEVFKKTP